jgi:pimeloyl-ACP methyl ester carboxylesterase
MSAEDDAASPPIEPSSSTQPLHIPVNAPECSTRTLSRAGVPTLLLFSNEDNGYRAGFLDRFARHLPLHTAVVLPQAAHFLTEDAPERYTTALEGWLGTRGAAATTK